MRTEPAVVYATGVFVVFPVYEIFAGVIIGPAAFAATPAD